MIVGREGCDGVVEDATAGDVIAEPVAIAGSAVDCGVAEGALLDDSCKFAGGVSLIVGREGCDDVAAGATEGVVEGALLVGSCEFAGESVSRARR